MSVIQVLSERDSQLDYDPQIPSSGRDVASSHGFPRLYYVPRHKNWCFRTIQNHPKSTSWLCWGWKPMFFGLDRCWIHPINSGSHWIWCRTYICSWYKDDPTKPNKLWYTFLYSLLDIKVILGLLLDTHFFQALCFRSYGCRDIVNPQRLDNVGVLVGDTWRIGPWPMWVSKEEGKRGLKNWDFTKNLIAQMGVSWGQTGLDSGNLRGCYWKKIEVHGTFSTANCCISGTRSQQIGGIINPIFGCSLQST